MKSIAAFLKGERGQDLVEYTLLIAFIVFASAALCINAGGSVTGIWTVTNQNLSAAQSQADGGS